MGRLDKERVSRPRGVTNGQKRALHGVSLPPIHCKGRADCNTHTTHYTCGICTTRITCLYNDGCLHAFPISLATVDLTAAQQWNS